MKKYKINWAVVARNLSIIFLLASCYTANQQLEDNEIKLRELDKQCQIELMATKHYLKSKLNHTKYSYLSNEEKPITIENKSAQNNKTYLGKFKITHYCACKKCCGPNAQGITASGKKVEEGKTIAVDKSIIKLGSKVKIDGYGTYEAQDTGSAIKGNKIDVYVADHQRALQMGVVYKDVWLIKEV